MIKEEIKKEEMIMTMTMKEDDDMFTWGNSVSKLGPDDQRRKPGLRFSSFDHDEDNHDEHEDEVPFNIQ